MNGKQKAWNISTHLLKTAIDILGGKRSMLIFAKLVEELVPIMRQKTDLGVLDFWCPGKIPLWRASTLLTKEPETIDWINSFKNTDIFWDIGANVGQYSLYAALRKLTILSFEPSSSNYYVLSRNIEINEMDDRILALCMAFSDITSLDSFYMANTEIGGALHSFGEAVDWRGQQFSASFIQAMIGFSIDDFIEQFNPPFPNHIKIDVDGNEGKIIKGSAKTLKDKRFKSLLVELDSSRKKYCNDVFTIIENAGLKLHNKEHAPIFNKKDLSPSCNYIFIRSENYGT